MTIIESVIRDPFADLPWGEDAPEEDRLTLSAASKLAGMQQLSETTGVNINDLYNLSNYEGVPGFEKAVQGIKENLIVQVGEKGLLLIEETLRRIEEHSLSYLV